MTDFIEDVKVWAARRPWLVILVVFLAAAFDVVVVGFLIGYLGAR